MRSRNGLVLTQVVDRNGVPTRRWTRPADASANAADNSIPLPAVTPEAAPDEDPMTHAIALRAAAHAYVSGINGGEEDFYTDLGYVDDLMKAAEEDLSFLPTLVLNEISRPSNAQFQTMVAVRDAIELERPVEVMRDILHALDAISEAGFDTDQFRPFVEDLASYPGIEPFDVDGEYPELRTRQLTALTVVTAEVEKSVEVGKIPFQPKLPSGMAAILDPELVRLTVTYPDRTPQLIGERETLDTDLLRALLESGTPAVSEGTL